MSLIKWNEENGQVRLGVPSDLDLPMAAPLVDSLRHAFNVGESVVVLADAVERVSSACIQALIVASRYSVESGQKFKVLSPSASLVEACADLGVADWLKQWSQT
ncbi:STAS domain-containing protein [Azospirillaceae bacterium]